MARQGRKGTFCGRSTATAKWLDPYRAAPESDDRWCKPCWETTVHVALPTDDDYPRDDTVVTFGRSPYSDVSASAIPRKSPTGASRRASSTRPALPPPAIPWVGTLIQSGPNAPAIKKRPRRWTEAEIVANQSAKGGFTRAGLANMGVPWPPPSNWKQSLMNGLPLGGTATEPEPTTPHLNQPAQLAASPSVGVRQKASVMREDQQVWIDSEGYLRHGSRRGIV